MPEPGHSERSVPHATLPLLEHRLSRVEERLDEHARRFDPLEDDVHTIRRDLVVVRDRQSWLIAGAVLLLSTVVGVSAYITQRVIVAELDVGAQTTREERLEAIADVLEQGGLPRTRDGMPRLLELQQALPTVRGISRSERAAACLRAEERVPGVCTRAPAAP